MKLEASGFVTTSLELSPAGTALKHVALAPFSVNVTIDTVARAVANAAASHDYGGLTLDHAFVVLVPIVAIVGGISYSIVNQYFKSRRHLAEPEG